MKKTMSLLLMSFIGLVGTYAWAGSAREDSVARLQSSVDVLHAIMATPDKGIPEETLSNAKCILVVPDLIKGGFIFGGKHGRGLTLEGAVVQQDDDSTRAIYSKDMTFRNILSGKASTPKSADAFIKAVSDAGQQARIAEATEDKK